METWVITTPKADRIYGTVQAETLEAAYRRIDRGLLVDWFWQAEPGPNEQLAVHLPSSLADGVWRETMPDRPLDAGDCGGDYQEGQALGRQFWLARPDGLWAMYQVSWYITEDTSDIPRVVGPQLGRQEEYLVCTDIRHPGDTEVFNDYRYQTEVDWEPVQANVEVAARAFDPIQEITWNGREFR